MQKTECPNCGFQLTASNVRRATRLNPDWQPTPEQLAWARNERSDVDPRKAAEMFRDFWIAKSGKDGAKLDWVATWRNWIRNTKATPAVTRTPEPACHSPADPARRKPMTEAEREANKRRLAQLLPGLT